MAETINKLFRCECYLHEEGLYRLKQLHELYGLSVLCLFVAEVLIGVPHTRVYNRP